MAANADADGFVPVAAFCGSSALDKDISPD